MLPYRKQHYDLDTLKFGRPSYNMLTWPKGLEQMHGY